MHAVVMMMAMMIPKVIRAGNNPYHDRRKRCSNHARYRGMFSPLSSTKLRLRVATKK